MLYHYVHEYSLFSDDAALSGPENPLIAQISLDKDDGVATTSDSEKEKDKEQPSKEVVGADSDDCAFASTPPQNPAMLTTNAALPKKSAMATPSAAATSTTDSPSKLTANGPTRIPQRRGPLNLTLDLSVTHNDSISHSDCSKDWELLGKPCYADTWDGPAGSDSAGPLCSPPAYPELGIDDRLAAAKPKQGAVSGFASRKLKPSACIFSSPLIGDMGPLIMPSYFQNMSLSFVQS